MKLFYSERTSDKVVMTFDNTVFNFNPVSKPLDAMKEGEGGFFLPFELHKIAKLDKTIKSLNYSEMSVCMPVRKIKGKIEVCLNFKFLNGKFEFGQESRSGKSSDYIINMLTNTYS